MPCDVNNDYRRHSPPATLDLGSGKTRPIISPHLQLAAIYFYSTKSLCKTVLKLFNTGSCIFTHSRTHYFPPSHNGYTKARLDRLAFDRWEDWSVSYVSYLESTSPSLNTDIVSPDSTTKNPDDVVITMAIRTPLTKGKKGGMKDTDLDFMVYSLLKQVRERMNMDPALVEDICMGNVRYR
jgi:hypothetical protein